MGEALDLVEAVREGVADRAAAWRFVRRFAEEWATPLSACDGCDERELAAAEVRLGVRLPDALREAYGLLGHRLDLTSHHDKLLASERLHLDDAGEAVVFRRENQGCASWGVLLADLEQPDPPVYMRPDLADRRAEKWGPWTERVSHAFIEIVLSEALHADDVLGDFLDGLETEHMAVLRRAFVPLPLPAYPITAEPFGQSRWYAGSDVILRSDGDEVFLVRARTEPAMAAVRDLLPGDWLNEP
jgi:hypothetical protein